MKFLPSSRSVALLALAATLCSCATAANRRELYNSSSANGPWHDYERKREAVAATGTTGVDTVSTTTTTTVRGRPTRMPPAGEPVPVTAPAPAAVPPPAPAMPEAAAPAVPAPAPDAAAPAVPAPPQ